MNDYNGEIIAVQVGLVCPGMAMQAESMAVACIHNRAPLAPSIQSPQEK